MVWRFFAKESCASSILVSCSNAGIVQGEQLGFQPSEVGSIPTTRSTCVPAGGPGGASSKRTREGSTPSGDT